MSTISWDVVGGLLDETARARGGIALSTHVNPDGDGLGSQLGLWHHLRERGLDARIINNDPVHRKYMFLPGTS